jgi:predicted site-specific integrase-resolvase
MIYKTKTISNWDKLPVALDIETVALIFDVTQTTVKNWLYNGTIQGRKMGRKWIFDKQYIKSLLNSERSGT